MAPEIWDIVWMDGYNIILKYKSEIISFTEPPPIIQEEE